MCVLCKQTVPSSAAAAAYGNNLLLRLDSLGSKESYTSSSRTCFCFFSSECGYVLKTSKANLGVVHSADRHVRSVVRCSGSDLLWNIFCQRYVFQKNLNSLVRSWTALMMRQDHLLSSVIASFLFCILENFSDGWSKGTTAVVFAAWIHLQEQLCPAHWMRRGRPEKTRHVCGIKSWTIRQCGMWGAGIGLRKGVCMLAFSY